MPDPSVPSRCNNSESREHHHRGRSSEVLVDKDHILKTLNIQPGQVVLDAGCGNGYMAKAFSKRVAGSGRVIALDPDEETIALLAEETRGGNIETLVASITRPTPLQGSSVDLLYLSTVIHGFTKPEMHAFVTEAVRLLKPGGMLAIVEMEKKETPFGPPLEIRISPDELKAMVPLEPHKTDQAGEHLYLQTFTKNAA